MDVLMIAAGLSPYTAQAPAGEVVAALSKTLRQQGHDVTVALPRYPELEASGLLLARRLTPLRLESGAEANVLDGQLPSGVRLVLFDAPGLFDRDVDLAAEDEDAARRFGFFAHAAAAFVGQRAAQGEGLGVVHAHDWPGALALALLRASGASRAPAVLTVHDVTRQGVFPVKLLGALGVPADSGVAADLKLGNKLSALKAGLLAADAVTTVSPSYALEMSDAARAGALAAVVTGCRAPVIGIHNGIDYSRYNPATDAALVSRYDAEDPSNKGRCKAALLRELGLELELDQPLVAYVGALSKEKGADLLSAALPSLQKNRLSLVVAGRGSDDLAAAFSAAAEARPDSFAFRRDPESALERRIFAAADIVLVPSRHEPCGDAQLIAQRFGALPVVHATGGLKDTVVDCDAELETGTGFVFDRMTQRALIGAVQRAIAAYASPAWPRLVRRVMRLDLAWDRAARRYLQVYRQAPARS